MPEHALKEIERRALKAQDLPAFPINLINIRENIQLILSEVGRYGFFNDYTDHSFRHVLDMLETAEWIIPEQTKPNLTEADWLVITLSIYLHDLGMLISKKEFLNRYKNIDYVKFKAEPKIALQKHQEFQARIAQLPTEEAEAVMYQEFVRSRHGERVRAWVEGAVLDDDNSSAEVRKAIGSLIGALDPTFRRDLGVICESHTRDDIADTKVFKLSQPYGNSAKETANLQYAATILRAVDLLQITHKRAPTALYQIINPTDPVSQLEWLKQNAVRSVRPMPGKDREGRASEDAVRDTIEVHARFSQAEGFFGLTSYLSYAERELQACNAAIAKSDRYVTRKVEFPWRYIDSSGVEADGFLTESFGFTIDQQRILDLLTGHTLYNDTTVVIRELTQNALDAVRLQQEIGTTDPEFRGKIEIHWSSAARILEVRDNGTGMSQEVIVNHLLKVGSSRYQDPIFKEKYPKFSSISRFGIGVLSAFMVSDNVQITTCSPDDDKARQIALRSVHGKYLIKLLDKISDREEIGIFPHGTVVRLELRPTANIGNVLQIASMWLKFPKADVTVQIDDQGPVKVGFASPKEALESYLASYVRGGRRFWGDIQVREVSEGGVTMAFAVERSPLFKDWGFLDVSRRSPYVDRDSERPPTGTCIEGVGVDFSSPGFREAGILSVANAVGPSAPKTNVARSAFEETSEYRELLAKIYRLYARHVTNEIMRLSQDEGYSLSRAVGEAPYTASLLLGGNAAVVNPNLLSDAVADIPAILIEEGNLRSNISYSSLIEAGEFWTIESPLSTSIETFVREAPVNTTARALLETLGSNASVYPQGRTACNFGRSPYMDDMIREKFEVAEVHASEELRSLRLRWRRRDAASRWLRSGEVFFSLAQRDSRYRRALGEIVDRTRSSQILSQRINIPIGHVQTSGLDGLGGFFGYRETFLDARQPIASFFVDRLPDVDDIDGLRRISLYLVLFGAIKDMGMSWELITPDVVGRYTDVLGSVDFKAYLDEVDVFCNFMRDSNNQFFDPFAWNRREGESWG